MARLALGIVGAVIGAQFGMPGLGFALGSALGGAVDPEVIKSTGPRLEDLKVQASTYGVMIPVMYGTQRVAGNVLWASPMRETVTTTEDDGKGGPVSETTTYSYSIDVAIGICEGEIAGIRKVWANGTLIYNIGDDADGITLAASAANIADSMEEYLGTETQLPDPTIEGIEGAGNVPAYRGIAYVVIADMQLANYGNRIPNIEFEVVSSGSTAVRGTSWVQNESFPEIFNPPFGEQYAIPQMATDGNILFVLYAKDAALHILTTRDLTTWNSITPDGLPLPSGTEWSYGALAVMGGAFYHIGGKDASNNTTDAVYRSLDEGATWEQVGTLPLDGGYLPSLRCVACVHNGALFVRAGYADGPTYMDTVWKSTNGIDFEIVCANPSGPGSGSYGALVSLNGSLYSYRGGFNQNAFRSDDDGVTWNELDSTGPEPFGSTIIGSGFDLDGALYAMEVGIGPFLSVSADGGYTWTPISGSPTLVGWYKNVVPFRGSLVLIDWMDPAVANTPYYDEQIKLWTSAGVLTSNTVVLADIVADLCERAGLQYVPGSPDAGEVDVSALTDSVWGYTLTRQAAARGNLAPLQKAFSFDAVESDGRIKFVKRGTTSAVTIPLSDIGATEGDAVVDPLEIRRAQESEMPVVVSVTFPNIDNAYQAATETARRLITLAEQQISETLPIPLSADQGAQLAEILMYELHIGRNSFTFATTRKYAKYEPTDVVVVSNGVGEYEMRLLKKDESGPLIKWEGVATAPGVYDSSAPGTTPAGPAAVIGVPGATYYRFLDIPILRDADDNAGFYALMARGLPGWGGATLFKSTDSGVTYGEMGSVVNSATFGGCRTILGNFTGGNTVDEKNTVDVQLDTGTLSSITYAELLNEGNAALIGSELINFRTATLLSPGNYRLSGLLRGRRGTEQHMSTHTGWPEPFALLSVPGSLRVGLTLAESGIPLWYKAVSHGTSLAVASPGVFTNNAVGLKPLSPVHIGGGKQANGDFIITWVRRTRLDGGWRPLVDAPLGESSEEYRVYIYDGATLKRILTVTAQTATYTDADQVTDFGSTVAAGALTIQVVQMSASIGLGFFASKTL